MQIWIVWAFALVVLYFGYLVSAVSVLPYILVDLTFSSDSFSWNWGPVCVHVCFSFILFSEEVESAATTAMHESNYWHIIWVGVLSHCQMRLVFLNARKLGQSPAISATLFHMHPSRLVLIWKGYWLKNIWRAALWNCMWLEDVLCESLVQCKKLYKKKRKMQCSYLEFCFLPLHCNSFIFHLLCLQLVSRYYNLHPSAMIANSYQMW